MGVIFARTKISLAATVSAAVLCCSAPIAWANASDKDVLQIGESASGNYLAALVAGADRDTTAAALFFREALRADPRNPDLLERAFASALSDGDEAGAIPLGQRLLARDPDNSLARLAIAINAISQGQYGAARAQLQSGDAGKAHDVTTTLLSAWCFAGQGDQRRALDALDRIHDAAVVPFRDFHAGLIADLMGNPTEARKRLKAAYEGDKGTLRFADAYARFLAAHGETDGAKGVYEEFARRVPHHPIVDAQLAVIASGKPLDSLVRNVKEGAAEALYGLGGAGGREGDELPALMYLRLALFLRPTHELAAFTVGSLYEQLKQNDLAIAAYEGIPKTSPMRETAEIQEASVLDQSGRSDEAMKRLSALVAQRPDDVEALTALAGLQRAAKQYDEAIATYNKAIAKVGIPDRSNWTLFYFRGICFERAKQWPKAEADFKTALDLYPDQPMVLNYLGYSWVDQGVHLDEAIKMLRRAVELRPTDGYIVDSLGWAHFKLGQYSEATGDLEKAVSLKPSDPVVNDHLGDAYWRTDRKIEAHFQWDHARDMGPEPEDLPAILKKIDGGLPDAQSAQPAPAAAAADAPGTTGAPAAPAPDAPAVEKKNGG